MWILTVYSKDTIKMFEFDHIEEAKNKCKSIQENKILSEIIYFNQEKQNAQNDQKETLYSY